MSARRFYNESRLIDTSRYHGQVILTHASAATTVQPGCIENELIQRPTGSGSELSIGLNGGNVLQSTIRVTINGTDRALDDTTPFEDNSSSDTDDVVNITGTYSSGDKVVIYFLTTEDDAFTVSPSDKMTIALNTGDYLTSSSYYSINTGAA